MSETRFAFFEIRGSELPLSNSEMKARVSSHDLGDHRL
jgi:hypothetical protein